MTMAKRWLLLSSAIVVSFGVVRADERINSEIDARMRADMPALPGRTSAAQ
jgi:hypothetical protein